jgi:hypothetical protein
LERLKAEMSRQEAQWKEAYDVLMAENTTLKSSGSEALLASQWRQRYETCLKEKDEIENKLKTESQKKENADAGKYEVKYRDLKESFRLYRKKAKEIFEAQNNGQTGVSMPIRFSFSPLLLVCFLVRLIHDVPRLAGAFDQNFR